MFESYGKWYRDEFFLERFADIMLLMHLYNSCQVHGTPSRAADPALQLFRPLATPLTTHTQESLAISGTNQYAVLLTDPHITYLPSLRVNIRLCDPFRVNERAHQLQLLLLYPLDILYQISASRSMPIRSRRCFTVSIEFGTM
jgi:hypothetical protein